MSISLAAKASRSAETKTPTPNWGTGAVGVAIALGHDLNQLPPAPSLAVIASATSVDGPAPVQGPGFRDGASCRGLLVGLVVHYGHRAVEITAGPAEVEQLTEHCQLLVTVARCELVHPDAGRAAAFVQPGGACARPRHAAPR